ncbi:MAG: SigB/SigF/SigG family RNA polymerase sigma factor [Clostridia bacterium]|nr:SigB/SigF/SigG family RNA polymerase sigma factor [Clostridia bacterium]MBQ1943020.1 SigB/SigF/SigG family RNA polymerase sigma factor [Clostridia bacterium]MBQ5802490.1 SigB/SigF/SigG family RNA polymerase sigma factor [Clostridia bacterium]
MLSKEETERLLCRAKEGCKEAKERLIAENSPLIKSAIRRYRGRGVEYEDLYEIGCIGFLKAIAGFDFSYGVKFTTYAVPMIAGEVMRFLRDDGTLKVSRSLKALAAKVTAYIEEAKTLRGTSPTVEELAKQFGVEPQEIVYAIGSAKMPVSLSGKEEGEERGVELIDRIPAKENIDDVIDKILLKDAIQSLTERERKIVMLRYFRDKTQSDVAQVLGISQVQVSRLENKILQKLREKL